MSNVPCYSVSSIIRDLSVARGVSLIRLLGNFEKKIMCTTTAISAPLSVHHSSEMKKIVMKIIFIHFLVNAIQK